ncbi:cinnamyl alcohol dehydrogenase [Raphidocelis subcapitata]|uniref:Cinnamyl alcohol dehydrogenase n=1 Tax=Raphidocelis subcapitata TaxID=307507 RepID=A0A2V0PGC1_9CHLO|nr:cinnamyl alcohol dehydrogenase [Raphidocelis subcapitata]|eukprot:GBF98062.1 cinnamyl alcohol dehydrogenase [Raphidocelis subcapitata]
MPRIKVKAPSDAEAAGAPREFSLLVQLAGQNGEAPREVLLKAARVYGDEAKAAKLADEPEFEAFAAAFNKPSQLAATDGEEGANCMGWAARSADAVLAPYRFRRRELGARDVFLKICYAGMCHSDLHTINGDWGPAMYPLVPGHEIVGIVAAVGPEVTKFKVGDRAGVGTYVDGCRKCALCKAGEEQFCAEAVFTYNAMHKDGIQSQGGYSSHIISDETFTFKVPDNLDLAGVAPLLCAGVTTYSPFKLYGLDKPGLKIGVVGLGGLGHMAVKWAVAFGSEVYVISRSRAKEADAIKMGAKALIPTSDEEAMKAAANSLDAIVDTVAAQHDFGPLFAMLRPKGKLCMVGAPPGKASFDWFPMLMKSLTLCSSLVIPMDYVNTANKRMEKGDVRFRFVIDINRSLAA